MQSLYISYLKNNIFICCVLIYSFISIDINRIFLIYRAIHDQLFDVKTNVLIWTATECHTNNKNPWKWTFRLTIFPPNILILLYNIRDAYSLTVKYFLNHYNYRMLSKIILIVMMKFIHCDCTKIVYARVNSLA